MFVVTEPVDWTSLSLSRWTLGLTWNICDSNIFKRNIVNRECFIKVISVLSDVTKVIKNPFINHWIDRIWFPGLHYFQGLTYNTWFWASCLHWIQKSCSFYSIRSSSWNISTLKISEIQSSICRWMKNNIEKIRLIYSQRLTKYFV